MFGWLKKKKPHWYCRHYKSFGESVPDNMVQILRFSPYKTGSIGYSISECTVCGTRAFGCIGLHMMGTSLTQKIDDFIKHQISLDDLLKVFKENKCWFDLNRK